MKIEMDKRCTYCYIEEGVTRDHVIPVAYASNTRHFTAGEIVPACELCNSLLGSKMYLTVPERGEYLYKRYKTKYKKLINMPDWEFYEVDELDRGLRSVVNYNLVKRDCILGKLGYLYQLKKSILDESKSTQ